MEKYIEIERSIIKKYREDIWSKFVKAVKEYKLINENDKIMVCISGGKDSFLLAKCIQELQRHGDVQFEAKYVVMDPGYKKENRKLIESNSKLMNIPIEIFESDIFNVVNNVASKSPCYLCARMRRGYLYNRAKELGCNKIALGHHFDDVIETTLLHEKSIISWKEFNNLKFLNCACKFTEKVSNYDTSSKRKEIKELINELRKTNKDVDHNIFTALSNINMNCSLKLNATPNNINDGKYFFLNK